MQQSRYEITAENRLFLCDEIPEMVNNFCEKYLQKKRDVLRFRLTVEECLLGWLTEDSIGHSLRVTLEKKRLRSPVITLEFDGDAFNPYETDDKKIAGDAGFSALRILGLAPTYSYVGGINTLRFDVNPSTGSALRKFLVIFSLAILFGYLGKLLLPSETLITATDVILTPVYNLILNLLSLISGPLIFLSVVWGIFNIADTISFNKIGKSVILTFLRNDFIVCLLGLVAVPFFGLNIRNGQLGESQFSYFVTMITDCAPANIVAPFYDGNTLQIIFMAIVVGIGLLFLGKKVSSLAKAVEQANILLQYLLAVLSKLVPYLIFIVVLSLFWTESFSIMSSAWKFFAILIAGTIVISVFLILLTAVRYKLSPRKLIKKIYPSVLIATMTACTTATLETSMDICTDKLGIKKSLVNFSVPLGMVVQNPVNCFSYLVMTLFCASTYKVECSVIWFLTTLLCCVILAIATPPIPGGGVVVFTMMFLQLGIPLEAVAIVSAMNIFADFLTTGGDVLFLFPSLIRIADKGGMLDTNQLRK